MAIFSCMFYMILAHMDPFMDNYLHVLQESDGRSRKRSVPDFNKAEFARDFQGKCTGRCTHAYQKKLGANAKLF